MRREVLYTVNLCKSVNKQLVLRHLSFGLYEGEILGILGKNNLGIAALVQILSGECEPDSGSLFIEDSQAPLVDIAGARRRGIYLISGESSLIPNFTVAENVSVCRPYSLKNFFINHRNNEKGTADFFDEYGFNLSPFEIVEHLSSFECLQVEMARALFGGAKILVFYQIGAGMSDEELELFKKKMHELQGRGISIICINTSLNNMLSFTDRILLLASGTAAGVMEKGEYEIGKIHRILFQKEFSEQEKISEMPGKQLIFSLEHLVLGQNTRPACFKVYRGEVTGVYSNSASGLRLFEMLMGESTFDGEVWIDGKMIPGRRWKNPFRFGVGGMGRDPYRTSLFPNLSVRENLMIRTYGMHTRFGILNWRLLAFMSGEWGDIYKIPIYETVDGIQNVDYLRNAAFPLIAWIAARPKVLVLHGILETADEVELQYLSGLMQACRGKGIAVIYCMDRAYEFGNMFDTVHRL